MSAINGVISFCYLGGETGKLDNYSEDSIDCRGVCYGGWERDACGYCEPWYYSLNLDPETESRYMDCSGSCYLPGKFGSLDQIHLEDLDICGI